MHCIYFFGCSKVWTVKQAKNHFTKYTKLSKRNVCYLSCHRCRVVCVCMIIKSLSLVERLSSTCVDIAEWVIQTRPARGLWQWSLGLSIGIVLSTTAAMMMCYEFVFVVLFNANRKHWVTEMFVLLKIIFIYIYRAVGNVVWSSLMVIVYKMCDRGIVVGGLCFCFKIRRTIEMWISVCCVSRVLSEVNASNWHLAVSPCNKMNLG